MMGSRQLDTAVRIYRTEGLAALSMFIKSIIAKGKRNPAIHDALCTFAVRQARDLTSSKV